MSDLFRVLLLPRVIRSKANLIFFQTAVPIPVATTAPPPCPDCSTVSGVLVASEASTDIIFLSSTPIAAADASGSGHPILHTMSTPAAVPRRAGSKRTNPVPQALYPLLKPNAADGHSAQLKFIRRLAASVRDDSFDNIAIVPSHKQLTSWFINDRKNYPVPIGVTAEFIEFGKSPKNFKMVGMYGCTAVFVVVGVSYCL